jgi:carboxynorspermidine decarboxylase
LITGDGYHVDRLVELLIRLQEKYSLKVILEPGAAFAWMAGYLVSRVQDVLKHHGVTTAMLDVSFAAHMPDCLEMPYQPNVLGAGKNTGNYQYRLGGNSCLAGDYVGMYGFPKPLETGDTIVFEDMMHYTMVKTTHFNGVTHPSIGIWKISGSFELWREFGYGDYKGRLS